MFQFGAPGMDKLDEKNDRGNHDKTATNNHYDRSNAILFIHKYFCLVVSYLFDLSCQKSLLVIMLLLAVSNGANYGENHQE